MSATPPDQRLPAGLEATALMRTIEANGDFATILKKGDPDRGALLLVFSSRDRHVACLERMLSLSGGYAWQRVGPAESAGPQEIRDFLARRTRFDENSWLIDLDVAQPERFIAETTGSG